MVSPSRHMPGGLDQKEEETRPSKKRTLDELGSENKQKATMEECGTGSLLVEPTGHPSRESKRSRLLDSSDDATPQDENGGAVHGGHDCCEDDRLPVGGGPSSSPLPPSSRSLSPSPLAPTPSSPPSSLPSQFFLPPLSSSSPPTATPPSLSSPTQTLPPLSSLKPAPPPLSSPPPVPSSSPPTPIPSPPTLTSPAAASPSPSTPTPIPTPPPPLSSLPTPTPSSVSPPTPPPTSSSSSVVEKWEEEKTASPPPPTPPASSSPPPPTPLSASPPPTTTPPPSTPSGVEKEEEEEEEGEEEEEEKVAENPTPPLPLSLDDISKFEEDGFVMLRGAFDPEVASACREALWSRLGEEDIFQQCPSTWVNKKGIAEIYGIPSSPIDQRGHPWTSALSPRLKAAVSQLVGVDAWEEFGCGWWVVTFPGFAHPPWEVEGRWHVDGAHFRHFPHSVAYFVRWLPQLVHFLTLPPEKDNPPMDCGQLVMDSQMHATSDLLQPHLPTREGKTNHGLQSLE